MIYDLDYRPTPVAAAEYVSKQWARDGSTGDSNDRDVPSRIRVVVIPAVEFIAMFPDPATLPVGAPPDTAMRQVSTTIKERSGRDLPQMSLQEFVDGLR